MISMYCFNGKFREELDLSSAKICRPLRPVVRALEFNWLDWSVSRKNLSFRHDVTKIILLLLIFLLIIMLEPAYEPGHIVAFFLPSESW